MQINATVQPDHLLSIQDSVGLFLFEWKDDKIADWLGGGASKKKQVFLMILFFLL